MRIFLSVGEPSGDVHGANLVRELHRINPDIVTVGFGGPRMHQAGCQLLADLTSLAVMFLWSVIKNYRTFCKLLNQADEYFRREKVDAVVLIDYPGFNWLIAARAKRHGIPVYYYGVPQMWAWAPWRVRKLRRLVDHVLCKLPFEPRWFQERGVTGKFVGHPFFDELAGQKIDQRFVDDFRQSKRPTLLLLPGSRDSEVATHWPIMRDIALMLSREVPELVPVVGAFHARHGDLIQKDLQDHAARFDVFVSRTPDLMQVADCALACSGSVSLELMYHQVPTVIVYRLSRLKYFLQHFLIRSRYITLVNLIATDDISRAGRGVYDPEARHAEQVPMPEFMSAKNCNAAISRILARWLTDSVSRNENREWLARLKKIHGETGATRRAAEYILRSLEPCPPQSTKRNSQAA